MKAVVSLAVLACVVAMATADGPGLRGVYGGVAAPYNNAARQVGVNLKAEKVGASSGTYRADGVPGAGRAYGYGYPGYYGYGYYGYPRAAYGYGYPYGYY